jgi:ATP-dependent DNA helicase RecQ
LELAAEHKWPAFCVAHDSVLREVARAAPTSLDALAGIKGIGTDKLQKFGTAFLQAIKG